MKPFPIHWNHLVRMNQYHFSRNGMSNVFFQFHSLIRRNSVASSVPELMSSCHRLLGFSDLCSCAPRRSLRDSLHQWYQNVGLGSSLVGMQHHGKVIKTYQLINFKYLSHNNYIIQMWINRNDQPQPGSWTLISWSWWRCWPGIWWLPVTHSRDVNN